MRTIGELSDTEKKLALLVIREMEKNNRSILDLEAGADAVLKVFRKVTAPQPKRSLKALLIRVLLPFSNPSHIVVGRAKAEELGAPHFSQDARPEELLDVHSPLDRPHHQVLDTAKGKKALIIYAWSENRPSAIARIRVLVELDTPGSFDTIAGEAAGPFEGKEAADVAGLGIASKWFEQNKTRLRR